MRSPGRCDVSGETVSASVIPVALIGYGYVGETFHAPLIAAEPGLRLAVVGSSRQDKVALRHPDAAVIADPLAAATDPRIALVVIATPNDTHVPLARAAIAAGKHVVVDKPFTLTLAEARDLSALAEKHRRLLSVFHNRRWDSDFLTVARAIADGLVGDVVAIESRIDRWRPAVRDRWREADVPGAGILYDLGPHLIDQLLCLFGAPVTVAAQVMRQRPGARVDDAFHLTLDWGDRTAILSASMLIAGGTQRWLVHGTSGTLAKRLIDIQEDQLKAAMVPGSDGWGVDPDPALFHDGSGAPPREIIAEPGDQSRYYAAIAAAIHGEGENPVPPAQAAAVVAVIEAARRSAAEGRMVEPAFSAEERAALSGSA